MTVYHLPLPSLAIKSDVVPVGRFVLRFAGVGLVRVDAVVFCAVGFDLGYNFDLAKLEPEFPIDVGFCFVFADVRVQLLVFLFGKVRPCRVVFSS